MRGVTVYLLLLLCVGTSVLVLLVLCVGDVMLFYVCCVGL